MSSNLSSLLTAVSVCLAAISGVLLTVIDVFKHYRPLFPAIPFMTLAWLSMLLSPLISLYGATQYVPGFRFWQPFLGGNIFVTLQAIGWFVWIMCLTVCAIFLNNFEQVTTDGILFALGVFSFGANVVLVFSIEQFVAPSEVTPRASSALYHLQPHPCEVRAIYALCAMSFFILFACDIIPHPIFDSIANYAIVSYVVSAGIVHVVFGSHRNPNFHIWQPFQGGFSFVSLQILGWVSLALMMYIFLGTSSYDGLPGLNTALASLGTFSQVILLSSLKYFNPNSTSTVMSTVGSGERLFCTVIALVHCLIFWALEITIRYGTFSIGRLAIAIPACTLLFAATPLTYVLGGKQMYPNKFRVWQPLVGGTAFVQLQALGWVSYAMSLFVMLLYIAHGMMWRHVWIVATTGFLSQLTILTSLNVYQPSVKMGFSPVTTSFLNGEWLVSAFMVFFSVVMFITGDILRTDRKISIGLVILASLFTLVATPLGHHSGRHYIRDLYTPFGNVTPEYVALQTLGWVLYAVEVILLSFSMLNIERILTDAEFYGFFSWNAVLGLVPWALIVCSLKAEVKEGVLSGFEASVRIRGPESQTHISEVAAELRALAKKSTLRSVQTMLLDMCAELEGSLPDESKSSPYSSVEKINSPRSRPGKSYAFITHTLSASSVLLYLASDLVGGHALPPLLGASGLVAASFACIGVHGFQGPAMYPKEYRVWQPFRGGSRFMIFSSLGWSLSGTCIAFTAIGLSWEARSSGALRGFHSFCGLIGAFSYVMLFMSLKSFNPEDRSAAAFETHAEGIVGGILMLFVFVFLFTLDAMAEHDFSLIIGTPLILLASVTSTLALPLVYYAITNSTRRWRETQIEEAEDDLRDLDEDIPLSMTEAAGWLFVAAFCSSLLVAGYQLYNRLPLSKNLLNNALFGCLIAYALLSLSVLSRTAEKMFPPGALAARDAAITFAIYLIPAMPAFLAYFGPVIFPNTAMYLLSTNIVALSFGAQYGRVLILFGNYGFVMYGLYEILIRQRLDLLLDNVGGIISAIFWIIYQRTMTSRQSLTGKRRWETAIRFFSNHICKYVAQYFSFGIVFAEEAGKPKVDDRQQYIFTYFPHGVFPFTVAWCLHSKRWRSMFPNMKVSMHVASIAFRVPIVRDILMWLGGREVTHAGLSNAIQSGESVLICPGGQKEMIYSNSDTSRMVVVTQHKGFVKFAIKHGVPLVPFVCFGENQVMDLVPCMRLQKWFLKKIHFVFPLIPYGRWFLPLPRPAELTLVVGTPFYVPKIENPTAEEVDKYHGEYYRSVETLIHNYRTSTPYKDLQCVLLW